MRVVPSGLVIAGVVVAAVVLASGGSPREGEAGDDQYLFFPGPGNGWVSVPDDDALEPQEALTWEVWLYLDSYASHPGNPCVSIIGHQWTLSHWVGVCSGKIRWYAGGGDARDSAGSVPLHEWVHIAVTYDETEVRFYVNGMLNSAFPYSEELANSSFDLEFGSDAAWQYTPQGAMDEVRLWSRARSEGEIQSTMNTVITGPMADLVGVWNFDAGPAADVGGFGGELMGDAEIISGEVPTPTVSRLWGDANCDDEVDPIDSLLVLRHDAGLDVSQEPGCPDIGELVHEEIILSAGAGINGDDPLLLWGDANCDESVDPIDSLLVLRFDAGLPVSQEPGCPDVGSEIVPVPGPPVIE